MRFLLQILMLLVTVDAALAQLHLGPEFRVNTDAAGDQYRPQVGVDGAGNFVVVWAGDRLAAQRFDRRDNRLGGERILAGASAGVELAMNAAGEYVAIWPDVEFGYSGL